MCASHISGMSYITDLTAKMLTDDVMKVDEITNVEIY